MQRGDETEFYVSAASADTSGVWYLARISYAAQTMQALCTVEGCTHSDTSCPAVALDAQYGPAYVLDENHLLFLRPSHLELQSVSISNRDGGDLRTITLGTGETYYKGSEELYTDGSELFSVVSDLDGSSFSLCAFDLETGAARTVCELNAEDLIVGACGRALLLEEDADRITYSLVNADTGEQTVLRAYDAYAEDRQGRTYDYSVALLDGQFYEYCYGTGALTVTDLATDETRTLAAQMPADPNKGRGAFHVDLTRIVDGYLEADYTSNDWSTEEQIPVFSTCFVNIQTGELREPPALPTQDYNGYGHRAEVYGQNADWLVMCCRTDAWNTTEFGNDGTPYTINSAHSYIGLLSKDDYLNGTPNYIELGLYQ